MKYEYIFGWNCTWCKHFEFCRGLNRDFCLSASGLTEEEFDDRVADAILQGDFDTPVCVDEI